MVLGAWGSGTTLPVLPWALWGWPGSSHTQFLFVLSYTSTNVLPVRPTFQRFDPAFQTTVSTAAELVKPAGVFIAA